MRPIDADALKKKAKMKGHCIRPMVTAYCMSVDLSDIDNAPTITYEDLVPHGRWIMHDDEWGLSCECSVCHIETCGDSPYCPNCGAKMDVK